VILTYDLAHGAQEICDIYRKRWQIELFFKWVTTFDPQADKTMDEFLTLLFPNSKRKSRGRRRQNANTMFEETRQQYENGNAENLDWLTYDPII